MDENLVDPTAEHLEDEEFDDEENELGDQEDTYEEENSQLIVTSRPLMKAEDRDKLLQLKNKINLKLLEGKKDRCNGDDGDSTRILLILPNGDQQLIGIKDLEKQNCENCDDKCGKCNKENLVKNKLKLFRKRKEPEVLVLSSDEEDSPPETVAKDTRSKDEELEEFKGGIAEYIMENNIESSTFTTLQCKWIRIGSYKVKPIERVFISSSTMRMIVPCVDSESQVILTIEKNEILKVTTHFGKNVNVIFMFVLPTVASKIRKSLHMEDKSGSYFDPTSSNETHKRIVFILEKLTEEHKTNLEKIFDKNTYNELEESEAKKILMKACKNEEVDEIKRILIYPPPPEKGGITINNQDYCCLADDQFLNDVIIDFYLKYLSHTVLSDEDKARTHVFSTFFYKRLTTTPKAKSDVERNMTIQERRHANVEKWTKNVNLFEKDFVVIPINEESHWFLAIICFPGLEDAIETEDGIKQPLILLFDSLLESEHTETINILRDYMQVEYNRKIGKERIFNELSFMGVIPSVPQQNNFTDCGVFLLEYVEMFFKTPLKSYETPLPDLSDWFDISIIPCKRRNISQLIIQLISEQGEEDVYELGLPTLFYSSDEEEGFEDEEFEEEEEEHLEDEQNEDDEDMNCEPGEIKQNIKRLVSYGYNSSSDDSDDDPNRQYAVLKNCDPLSPLVGNSVKKIKLDNEDT